MFFYKGLSVGSTFYRLFSLSFAWNALEAFGYQTIFLFYQIMLSKTIPQALFNTQGVFFATAYLAITLLDGAFDNGVIPVFKELSQSKVLFKEILNRLILQGVFLLIASLTTGAIFLHLDLVPMVLKPYFTTSFLVMFSGIVFLEGTKKNIRALLHLGFKNKFLAYVEIVNIGSYATCVLLSNYFIDLNHITHLILPFLSISGITVILLAVQLKSFYNSLSVSSGPIDKKISRRFFISRFFSYLNQVTRIIFSSNFLLPFFSLSSGLFLIENISLINTITFTCTCLIQKIFGPLGAALFAHAKNFSSKQKREIFSTLEGIVWKLSSIFLVLFLLYSGFFKTKQNGPTELLIILFFLAHLVESCFIVYEKFFIAEEKQWYLLVFNTLNGILFLTIISLLKTVPFIYGVTLSLIVRLISFALFARYLQKRLIFSKK